MAGAKRKTLKQKAAQGAGSGKSRYGEKLVRRRALARQMGAPDSPLPVLTKGLTEEEQAAENERRARREAELARLAALQSEDGELAYIPEPETGPDAHLESSFDERTEIGGDE